MTYLDTIFMQRQKIAAISSDRELEKEKIECVIEAGRLAPFAGLVQKDCEDFRHFFVIHRDSKTAKLLEELCSEERKKESQRIREEGLDTKYPVAAFFAEHFANGGAADLFAGPWIVVIAERGGYPAREDVCLGYVMENMWLKSMELQLAFKPCSIISDVKDKEKLKNILGLDDKENYAFDGCNIGYPVNPIKTRTEHKKPVRSITYFTE